MKLSDMRAKLTCNRTKVLGALASLTVAGAALMATPAAQAQRFAVGVQFGAPVYAAPAPIYAAPRPVYVEPRVYGYGYAPGYWEHRRAEEWREHEAREAWARHEAWEHRGYGAYGYRR